MSTESALLALKASFDKYLNLNYIQSRSDPEEEPYKTKYAARELLSKLIADLDKNYASVSDDTSFLGTAELGHLKATYEHFHAQIDATCQANFSMSAKSFLVSKLLDFNLAKNFIETEEVESGERLISKVVKDFKLVLSKATTTTTSDNPADANQDLTYNPLVFNLFLSSMNELVYVWSHRGNYKKCLTLVSIIEEIYANYKENSAKSYVAGNDQLPSYPFDPSELICLNKELSSEKRRSNFEALYTHSLFFMAQIYGKLDERDKSATYCQLTLQRQMDEHCESVEESLEAAREPGLITEKDLEQQPQEKVLFNSLEWATHAAAISQYYLVEDDFATARHCLCSAEAILEVLNNELGEAEVNGYRREKILEQTASIRRCWGKYALELLKISKLKLLESADLPDQKSLLAERDKVSKFRFNLPSSVYKIDKAELEAITSNIALDFDEARNIFLKAQTILSQAKDYFKLDGFVSDHCEVVRDLSELYAALAFFEPEPDRRAKMQKRRLDLVKPVCDELNEQYYLTLKRQYLFDVGTIYSELMDIKYDSFKEKKEASQLSAKDSAHAVAKINALAVSSIEHFEKFLDTMKVQPERKVLPDKFDDHNARPALLAKFYIGRLYSKIITLEPEKRLANVKQTSDCYTYLVNYCEKHSSETEPDEEDIKRRMKVEYDICKEMITFLPVQMEKLREMIKN